MKLNGAPGFPVAAFSPRAQCSRNALRNSAAFAPAAPVVSGPPTFAPAPLVKFLEQRNRIILKTLPGCLSNSRCPARSRLPRANSWSPFRRTVPANASRTDIPALPLRVVLRRIRPTRKNIPVRKIVFVRLRMRGERLGHESHFTDLGKCINNPFHESISPVKWDSCPRRSPRILSRTNTIFRTEYFYGLGVSAEGLREVGRAGISVREAFAGTVRRKGDQELALGSLERAGHRLLERQPGRVFKIIRFRCSRNFTSGAGAKVGGPDTTERLARRRRSS